MQTLQIVHHPSAACARIRALRAARRRTGLCTECGQLNATPETAVCPECLAFKRAKRDATRAAATPDASPYYLPLCAEPFERFERGEKDTEYRLAGGRFTARNFPAGRRVVLAKGYAPADHPQRALRRTVAAFSVVPLGTLPDATQSAIRIYLGKNKPLSPETLIACIRLIP